uniref:Uncharacterized protein n=1 Tax=Arundo donax TaxID=35708 RepID=A0A0A9F6W4_ARUDO
MSPGIDSGNESSEEWWSPVRDQVESPDSRLGSPGLWPNETLGSPSMLPDERHGLQRLLPQNNNRGAPRFSFSDRRSLRSDRLGIRRPSTQSLMQRGFSNRHSGHRSSNRGYGRTVLDRSYARNHDRSIDNSSLVPSRRQRLWYTHRSQY